MNRRAPQVLTRLPAVLSAAVLLWTAVPAAAQEDTDREKMAAFLRSIDWVQGPSSVSVGEHGDLKVPDGHLFTGPTGTRRMLEKMENPTDGSEIGFLCPTTWNWFLIFEFSPIGYVKDADKEELDGEEILDSIKEGTEQSNEERKKRGWPTIQILGWQTAPFFDSAAKNLQWCIKGESQGHTIVNYNTRLLGRLGVMSANLLVDPNRLDETLPQVKSLLEGFSFKEGKRYAEYKSGDKIAEYGLAALVVGGTVGVAAKLGLFTKLLGFLGKMWKLIIVGLIAVGAAIKGFFFRKKTAPPRSSTQEPGDSTQEQPGDES